MHAWTENAARNTNRRILVLMLIFSEILKALPNACKVQMLADSIFSMLDVFLM